MGCVREGGGGRAEIVKYLDSVDAVRLTCLI